AVVVRPAATEEKAGLAASGFAFDVHCLFGGQLADDEEAHLYLIYPEGNWVEVRSGTPYVIIGAAGYGKPILDRMWQHTEPLYSALQVGMLAFDATRTSSS